MGPNNKRRRDTDEVVSAQADVALVVDATNDELKSGPPRKKQQQRRSIFIRSLPPTATNESLISHFSQSLPIQHATAVIDRATNTCKGYGFVTFADAEDAQRALQEFNGSSFEGRKIKLEIAEPRKRDVEDTIPGAVAAGEAKPRSVPSAATVEAKAKREKDRKDASRPPKLIIRNLPWSIKKPEQLAELFKKFGKVHHATIPTKKPGLMTGFGFVTLRGRPNAEKALAAVNGLEIDGRTLAVDWAVEKEVWQGQNKKEEPVTEIASPTVDEQLMDEDDEDDIDSEDGVIDEDMEDDEEMGSDEEMDEEDDIMDDDEEGDDEEDQPSRPNDNSTTLFVRNLPFTSSDETLEEHFTQFGAVRYARIVLDRNTERPKGTGFVCFYKSEDALQCLREAPKANMPNVMNKKNPSATAATHSILQNEGDDPSGKYTVEGRVLQISKAVDKNEATRLTEEGIAYRSDRDKDKRRLYLLSEGTISSKSPLYELLSSSEVAMREASAKQRKTMIQSNPSLNLSLTRLSIRNIPRSVTSKDLKALAREAVVGFAKDVKEGKRARLSKEELARGGDAMVEAEKLRKKKGVGIVKQAKVVFEGREGGKVAENTGAGRSRGYGFIEYYSHRSALMGLRWLNGHALGYTAKEAKGKGGKVNREEAMERKKRLIAEFAIENAQVVNRRNDREVKSRDRPERAPRDSRAHGQSARRGVKKGDAKESRFTVVNGTSVSAKSPAGKKAASTEATSNKGAGDAKGENNVIDKQAKRTQIIARKRAARRGRKNAA